MAMLTKSFSVVSVLFYSTLSLANSCPPENMKDKPYGLPYAAINCYEDHPGLESQIGGDPREQNFLRVRKNNEAWSDEVRNLKIGDNIEVFLYITNSGEQNRAPSLQNTRVNINWTELPIVWASISANNARPRMVRDQTRIVLGYGQRLTPLKVKSHDNRWTSIDIPEGRRKIEDWNFGEYPAGDAYSQSILVSFRVEKI